MRTRLVGVVRGHVQGVGFRPFVARLAREMALDGRVRNAGGEVRLEIEGDPDAVRRFAQRLRREAPRAARIEHLELTAAEPIGATSFRIEASEHEPPRALPLPPDLATCEDCLAEVDDPSERRAGYPFTNCTACGPRYTIASALPYDRARTTMARFAMCARCRAEYDDPRDRRHHAQPIACPACGPTLRAVDGDAVAAGDAALALAVATLRGGGVVALQGLGGFQLLCDATDEAAVRRLRARKARPDEPFAVLARDLDAARAVGAVGAREAEALTSPAAPIVILTKRGDALAESVAPRLSRVGVMLPTTPLHHLLARAISPLVCTSGNPHGEPIAIEPADARARLDGIADLFLEHDRPIARRVDDGVVHVVAGAARVLRLGRGLGPASFGMEGDGVPRLCVGGHLKSAPAASLADRAVLWPHVGDLDAPLARDAYAEAVGDLQRFLGLTPEEIVCDLHPDYATSIWAERAGRPLRRIPHHAAHVAAVLAEHGDEDALGFAWDGFGLGEDGGLGGGETIEVTSGRARHVGSVMGFPLPGPDAAARDGRRALAGVLAAAGRLDVADPRTARFAPLTRRAAPSRSVGRLFDAVAAMKGVCAASSYEGQAARELEAIAEPGAAPYPTDVSADAIDWRPMVGPLLAEPDPARAASRFHATLADAIARTASARASRRVVLSGGCFQNAVLVEETVARLEARGVEVRLARRAPPNDGGLALGQAWLAARAERG